jgi:histone H3/H4
LHKRLAPRVKSQKKNIRRAGRYSGVVSGGRTGPNLLPLARIKKVMKKSGDNVKMVSGEAPIVFSKACELFIEELTQRSWMVAMQRKKKTLHKEDLASAIIATDIFDFLVHLVSDSTHPLDSAPAERQSLESN